MRIYQIFCMIFKNTMLLNGWRCEQQMKWEAISAIGEIFSVRVFVPKMKQFVLQLLITET